MAHRISATASITATTLAAACSSSVTPPLEGTYEAVDAISRCQERANLTSSTASYGNYTLTIELEDDGVHTMEVPSIHCPIHGTIQDDKLRFASQACMNERNERDIHGTARWNDDHELAIHLESSEYWPPNPELWPDGLVWDCAHDYLLVPIDE